MRSKRAPLVRCPYRIPGTGGVAVRGLPSLRLCIVSPAPVGSRRVGPAQWRGAGCLAGGSIIGPRPFWFFLGQCQKEQSPLTQHQPNPNPSQPTPHITTQHSPDPPQIRPYANHIQIASLRQALRVSVVHLFPVTTCAESTKALLTRPGLPPGHSPWPAPWLLRRLSRGWFPSGPCRNPWAGR